MTNGTFSRKVSGDGCKPLHGWIGLGLGVAAFWFLTFVLLPLGQRLPMVEPVMEAIAVAELKPNQYWYTQSEETAQGAMHVRNTLDGLKRRK
jgi:hypothetical protein